MKGGRYNLIDSIRGITVISMILFHLVWDLVNIFGFKIEAFNGPWGKVWQLSICISFIVLSGFCFCLSKSPIKRGCEVFIAGVIVSFITIIFVPEERILFGILTLIGSCMCIFALLDKMLKNLEPRLGLVIGSALFLITFNINLGYVGIGKYSLYLPKFLYNGILATYMGFMDSEFFSTDYYSILPWIFLFSVGYFINKIIGDRLYSMSIFRRGIRPLNWIGKNALLIYLLHQIVIYGALLVIL